MRVLMPTGKRKTCAAASRPVGGPSVGPPCGDEQARLTLMSQVCPRVAAAARDACLTCRDLPSSARPEHRGLDEEHGSVFAAAPTIDDEERDAHDDEAEADEALGRRAWGDVAATRRRAPCATALACRTARGRVALAGGGARRSGTRVGGRALEPVPRAAKPRDVTARATPHASGADAGRRAWASAVDASVVRDDRRTVAAAVDDAGRHLRARGTADGEAGPAALAELAHVRGGARDERAVSRAAREALRAGG
jgi:hypothetical protein